MIYLIPVTQDTLPVGNARRATRDTSNTVAGREQSSNRDLGVSSFYFYCTIFFLSLTPWLRIWSLYIWNDADYE